MRILVIGAGGVGSAVVNAVDPRFVMPIFEGAWGIREGG
jgi:shikimate 5-dehydrogenase